MWSIPHQIVTWQLNSSTLETLEGLLLSGLYNMKQLWMFKPCKGTKLAMEELACMEEDKGENTDQEGEVVDERLMEG